ncbi:hypothetical protein SNE26_10170 [Mucilaginibacter sp. cycad4]|uniref:hypothetical protein n=1 Tax=Mucilaginibacter sp. cycad4 TaxID=3342096 RepID=UPI002AABD2FC|nr:hypothetical protein [Mucilaginibacter gossypii]WPV02141.1 hypothetical protein SNE26_10170 [Mucilaginibacter gossypii]
MTNRSIIARLIVISFTIISCQRHKNQGNYSVTKIAKLPNPVNITTTPNNQHIIYPISVGSKQHIIFDNEAEPEFEGIYIEKSFVMGHDFKRHGYLIATNKTQPGDCPTCGPPGKWRAVIDRKFSAEYDKIAGITFSDDDNSVAFAAMKKRNNGTKYWVIVLNNKELPGTYDAISNLSPEFMPGGKSLMYVVKNSNNKSMVAINGTPGYEFDHIGHGIPLLSPDGKHFAYTGLNYTAKGSTVVFDGKIGQMFDEIPEQSLVFSPESNHFAYGAHSLNDWQVIIDGVAQKKYRRVDNIAFSQNGNIAYKAKKGEKWIIVLNGQEGMGYDSIMTGFPKFSPNSKYLAYSVKQNGRWIIKVEDVGMRKEVSFLSEDESSREGEILSPEFSPDSKRLAFVTKIGNQKMVISDGEPSEKYDDIVSNIVFSADNKHFAFVAKRKKTIDQSKFIVVIDGKEGPECDRILNERLLSDLFSSDNINTGYAACISGKWYFIINQHMSNQSYDTICNFLATSKGGYISMAIKNQTLYRINWNR